jgi:hypothetical protein
VATGAMAILLLILVAFVGRLRLRPLQILVLVHAGLTVVGAALITHVDCSEELAWMIPAVTLDTLALVILRVLAQGAGRSSA